MVRGVSILSEKEQEFIRSQGGTVKYEQIGKELKDKKKKDKSKVLLYEDLVEYNRVLKERVRLQNNEIRELRGTLEKLRGLYSRRGMEVGI